MLVWNTRTTHAQLRHTCVLFSILRPNSLFTPFLVRSFPSNLSSIILNAIEQLHSRKSTHCLVTKRWREETGVGCISHLYCFSLTLLHHNDTNAGRCVCFFSYIEPADLIALIEGPIHENKPNGACVIGLKPLASIPLLVYDL